MGIALTKADVLGLARPAVDAHMLGIDSVSGILSGCGIRTVIADAAVSEAFTRPEQAINSAAIIHWLKSNRITALGFSYRLDPRDGEETFGRLVHQLRELRLLAEQGGPVRALYFAGLPETCRRVRQRVQHVAAAFCGDETPAETLALFGIDPQLLPQSMAESTSYDEARLAFGRDLVRRGDYLSVKPLGPRGYDGFGTARDTLVARVRHHTASRLPPLMRAHVGPYGPNRVEAVGEFLEWTKQLARSGLLDVLSIGTSQLTQSSFGENWGDRQGSPNGGGVPINSPAEFATAWQAARPMLVRAYAGTRNIPALARMYEQTIHIAWHALSLWWFCRIDGRGPYSVRENLDQHVETLRYIAATGKPFEPNVPHHFAFRGADDVTCIVSAALAAGLAKSLGIRRLVLQNMLNTPKCTWGVADLAKSRAMLRLVRELEDDSFCVMLQPRGGLDYFSHDMDKAKAQLAAVTALMDDIEPNEPASPPIIHVVSYSEAAELAGPLIVDESIQITRHALAEYRKLRAAGQVDDMARHPDVAARTEELVGDARTVIRAIEANVPDAYSAQGLYEAFAAGYLPVPYLWECKEEFGNAIAWKTRLVNGSVKLVDEAGRPLSASERVWQVAAIRAMTG